jgi:hypothetical protein
VRGARDPIVAPHWVEAVARMLPRGHLVMIPAAAHTVPYSASVELVQAIGAFRTTVLGRAPSPSMSVGSAAREGATPWRDDRARALAISHALASVSGRNEPTLSSVYASVGCLRGGILTMR